MVPESEELMSLFLTDWLVVQAFVQVWVDLEMIRVERSQHYKMVEQETSASEETAWWFQCLWTYETLGCGRTTKKTKSYMYISNIPQLLETNKK